MVANCPSPVPPCGGCRQKIAEFADEDVIVTLATVTGKEKNSLCQSFCQLSLRLIIWKTCPNARRPIHNYENQRKPNAQRRGTSLVFQRDCRDRVSDAQAAAFAMAVTLNGLDETGCRLTAAMRDSGDRLTWKTEKPILTNIPRVVWETASRWSFPLLAAADIYVPMISDAALVIPVGLSTRWKPFHTKVQLDESDLTRVLDRAGCAIISATQYCACRQAM